MWHVYARNILKKRLQEMKKKNPSYSLRAFARKLEIGPSALSEIIGGRRKASRKTIMRLLNHVPLSPSEKHKMTLLMRQEESRKVLPEESLSLVTGWQYFAILSVFELKEPPRTIKEISERLNIPDDETQACLNSMIKLGMVEREDEFYAMTGEQFTSTDGVPSEAVMRGHESELKLAAKMLRKVPPAERDFTSLTFAGTEKEMQKARKEVRRFRDRIYSIMSGPSKDQVYKLSIQLFPVLDQDGH